MLTTFFTVHGIFDPPSWSDWHEKPLGHHDAPQLIQCRTCRKLKPAHHLHYRPIRSSDRFRHKCRACEQKSAYRRTLAARMAEVRAKPGLAEPERAALMLRLPDEVKASKSRRVAAARATEFDDDFKQLWKEARKIVAARRELLVQRIAQSKRNGTGLWLVMEEDPTCARYVRTVLAVYSSVVARLRDQMRWRATIGDHLPPQRWQTVIASPTNDMMMEVSPFEFTTKAERDMLSRMDPEKHNCHGWFSNISESGRSNGTIKYHVYPLLLRNGRTRLETSPPWLLAWSDKEGEEGTGLKP